MSNIKIPGESIKTKKDAGKFLKDINNDIVDEGWVEHEHKMEDEKRNTNQELCKCIKDRVVLRFSMPWAPGQWESIFGGKRERKNE